MKYRISIPGYLKRIFRILLWLCASITGLLIALSLLLAMPPIQKLIVKKATKIISEKANMQVDIGSIHIAFPKAIDIGEIFIADTNADTLLFCNQLKINTELLPLIQQKINIDYLLIDGLKANVYKKQSDSLFNFSPLMNLFSTNETKEKKNSESAWEIGLDELELKNISAVYKNQIDSSGISLELGYLLIENNFTEVISGKFDIEKIDLRKTFLSITIAPKIPENQIAEPKKELELPFEVILHELNVNDLHFDLNSVNEKITLMADLKQARIAPKKIDLKAFDIELNNLEADGIDVYLKIMPGDSVHQTGLSEQKIPDPANNEFTFGNFPWNFLIDQAEIHHTSYKMDLGPEPRDSSGIDYMHMEFSNFNVTADSIYFNKNTTGASVQSLSVKEISGPEVTSVSGKFHMNNQQILAEEVALQTSLSNIQGSVALSYPALNLIGPKIDQFGIETDLNGKIHVSETAPFTSVIDQYPVLRKFETITVKRAVIAGVLSDLKITEAEVAFSDNTILKARAGILGLPSTNIKLNYSIDTFLTTYEDLHKFIPDTLLPENIQLPKIIALKSTGETDLTNGKITGKIVTDIGNLSLEIALNEDQLHSELLVSKLDLGAILSDTTFGVISFNSQIEAKLSDMSLESFTSNTDVQSLNFNAYNYQNGNISFDWVNDAYVFSANVADTSLAVTIEGDISKKDAVNHFNMNMDISKSKLHNLNFMEEYFSVEGKIAIDLDIKSSEEFKGWIKIDDVDLATHENLFHIDSVRFNSDINQHYTNFSLNSEIIDASLTGNTKIIELKDVIIDHLDHFISLPDSITNDKDYNFEFDLDLKKPDFITDFLIEDLDEIELEKFHAKYNDDLDFLEVEIIFPKIMYKNVVTEGLSFTIDSQSDSAIADMEIKSISYDSSSIKEIKMRSEFVKDEAKVSFSIPGPNGSAKYQLITQLYYKDSIYQMTIDPDNTVIDYEKWNIPADNLLQYSEGQFLAKSAAMSNGKQKIWLGAQADQLKLNFENFSLQNITHILDHDSSTTHIQGRINGFIEILSLFTKPKIISELNIPDLAFNDTNLGSVDAKMEYGRNSTLGIDVHFQNDENSVYIAGTAKSLENDQEINIILETDIKNANSFQPFFSNMLKDLQGGIKGRLAVNGNVTNPSVNGNFSFNKLGYTIIPTNTRLTNNGQISIVANQLSFQKFILMDSLSNQLSFEGNIDFANFNNPQYDVSLKTDEFLLINSRPSDNNIIVGRLNLGMDIAVQGKENKLKVRSEFTINKDTDIAYIMPAKELELITDEGIVKFVDFENPEEEIIVVPQNRFIGDSIMSQLEGIDFTAFLNINPEAKFKLVIDPNSGDFTEFQVKGKMEYKYNDTQRGFLTGLVEFENGYYDLSFYGLVKKRFQYDPGSTVSWAGDVMDGSINFSARYTVRTNSVGLVSNEISSNERALYNQRLPYDVILNVTEKISYPSITFALDLPERYRSSYPTLDAKLNIMNQPAMESERNKQVFALLVGGTFIPENPDVNDGSSSSSFATTAAINSVNSIMTQQLNKLTGQLIQGLDIDMGVNTFDDYATGKAQTRTQLDVKVSKNLFNDRISAEVESHINLDNSTELVGNQSTAGMTEFAVSYKLTEAGNYRIKAFRENAYDIFDGEIQNSGIAFIFVREFDRFRKKESNMPTDKVNTPKNNKKD